MSAISELYSRYPRKEHRPSPDGSCCNCGSSDVTRHCRCGHPYCEKCWKLPQPTIGEIAAAGYLDIVPSMYEKIEADILKLFTKSKP